ncbi:hypothetical protein BDM02DRAFT_3262523 [Thelephora ganbajun]|uniref:Uncharacterized protein n=1 Tax=Thelephora ganbajun TaxID=370292 RepID=A0ACB6Z9F6_THEGA|nr:hypothetical protein BDM02DRAFT_3262523 [Thelephora ganbajun]
MLTGASTSPRVDETPITRGTPKAKTRPKPKLKGKRSPTRLAPSDGEHNLDSGPSPTKRIPSPKVTSGTQTKVTTPKSDPKPKTTRKSITKPKSTRSTERGSTTAARPKSEIPRGSEVFVDMEGDDHSSSLLPPSPSPAPPIRPRIRGVLKRKRRVSSGPSSGEDRSGPKVDPGQRPSSTSRSRAITSEAIDVDADDHGDNPETGGSKLRTRLQSSSKTTTEVTSASAPANTIPVVASSSGERREDDTLNRIDGLYTHPPLPPPLPMGFSGQTHQSFAQYPGHHPPFQDHAINFNHAHYQNHDHNRYGHGSYPLFQDPSTQALLVQAVTQLAVIVNGGRPPPQVGHIGGMPGTMQAMNGFPSSPGWGMFPAWPPSTPTTSRYPYGHDHQQRLFQSSYVTHHQAGGGAGLSTPSSALFPLSNTFPSSLSLPESIPGVQTTGSVQERVTNRTNDPAETSKRRAEGSPPTMRGRSQTRSMVKETPFDQDSGEEGSDDRRLSPKNRNGVRGRTPGPSRR